MEDASLGVGHVWNRTACPAYSTDDPADCNCSPGGPKPKPVSTGDFWADHVIIIPVGF